MSQAQDANAVKVTAYAKVDATHVSWPKSHHGIPVLVRVEAPAATSERAPIDLVAVLDARCGRGLGPVNRMDLLERAMKLVIDKLGSHDRLAIVPVQATSSDVQPSEKYDLKKMDASGRSKAADMVQSLVAAGDNKLSTALKNAVQTLKVRNDEEKKRAGFIILISDGDDSSISHETAMIDDLDYPVHTFGFRDAHNPRAMHHIANNSGGTYGILNDEHDGISEAFIDSLNNIASIVTAASDVEISCDEKSAATLSGVESGRFRVELDSDNKKALIKVGALQARAVRSFIVYVDNVGDDDHNLLWTQLTIHVNYKSVSSHDAGRSVDEKQRAKVVLVKNGDDKSREVAAEIVRVEAMKIIDKILDRYKHNGMGLACAANDLRREWNCLKESAYGSEAAERCLISGLVAEMEEMEASIRRCSGMSYMLSWQTRHSLQHQTTRTRGRTVTSSAVACSPAVGGAPPCDHLVACGARNAAHTAAMAAADANCGLGGAGAGAVDRKRKYQNYYHGGEQEMIDRRLTFWKKVRYELPPMHRDCECPDHMTTIFQKATQESLDHAMFHDVFLAIVHNTCRRGSKCGGDCCCGGH